MIVYLKNYLKIEKITPISFIMLLKNKQTWENSGVQVTIGAVSKPCV